MTTALTLTPSQAEAVYSAMCALNNVGMVLSARIHGSVVAWEDIDGMVHVQSRGALVEAHENQAAFAVAYGLNSDEPQSDVAAAAGGLTQTAIER